ncbi:hypothetical protein Tco_0294500 [Tanacetum coccineum]
MQQTKNKKEDITTMAIFPGKETALPGLKIDPNGQNLLCSKKLQSKIVTIRRIIWHYDAKGNYTVKSEYRQALKWCNFSVNEVASSSSFPNPEFWKKLLSRIKEPLGLSPETQKELFLQLLEKDIAELTSLMRSDLQ